MPSLQDLIAELSGIHVNDRNRKRAVNVAGHLVKFVLGDQWHKLTERQRELLVKPSYKRLWDNYMHKRKNLGQSTKQDATQAIEEELEILKKLLLQRSK